MKSLEEVICIDKKPGVRELDGKLQISLLKSTKKQYLHSVRKVNLVMWIVEDPRIAEKFI